MADDPLIADATLTLQELEAAYLATYDLGPGYPQIPVPDYIRALYLDDSIEDLSLKFAPFWTPRKQRMVDEDLQSAFERLLRVERHQHAGVRVTFSGSIALDRALTACTRYCATRETGPMHADVVTTSPCIDIMRLFLTEKAYVNSAFVESSRDLRLQPEKFYEALRRRRRILRA